MIEEELERIGDELERIADCLEGFYEIYKGTKEVTLEIDDNADLLKVVRKEVQAVKEMMTCRTE